MEMTRVESKYEVTYLRLDGFIPSLLKFREENDLDNTDVEITFGSTWGLIEHLGKHYLINSEGILHTVSVDDEPANIECYVQYRKGDAIVSFDIIPFCVLSVTYADLLEHDAIKDKVVGRLHNFIRSFGSRLDGNYYRVVKFLDGLKGE